MKFNVIVKIRKYREFKEGHHFISMPMKMHSLPRHDMNCPKPSIIIKSHDLHVGDIREAKGEIAFYLDSFLPR